MSHLIAHGRAQVNNGQADPENVLAHAFLNDNGDIEITAESPGGDVHGDIVITFPASAVAPAVAKRIRGRAHG